MVLHYFLVKETEELVSPYDYSFNSYEMVENWIAVSRKGFFLITSNINLWYFNMWYIDNRERIEWGEFATPNNRYMITRYIRVAEYTHLNCPLVF